MNSNWVDFFDEGYKTHTAMFTKLQFRSIL